MQSCTRNSCTNPWIFRITAVIGFLLAAMYLQTAWAFITEHRVNFIGYVAESPQAHWALGNLGARLAGIGCGFLAAIALRNARLLALMFFVRLIADSCDLFISSTTTGIAPLVPMLLSSFVLVELLCLVALLRTTVSRS